jgi:predicted PurR-regulated permease PerM
MDALLPPAILLGLNTIEANLVQPWLLSRRIVISPVAIFVMVAALVWMWGVAAAITAVPALILFHTIAQHVPPLRPLARVLATEDRYTNGHNGGPRFGTFTAFIRLPIRRPSAH